ncbi:fumarylacetoacetate hydrolase family protein [Daldinia decipiens]|uniref:fumarylacetoacetate hydrolase family protein n=1 Tax=Daldinia decipiens TaxID=326647 RepID=UPI0020C51F9F|nr:fumarylacetoacetate hydrolase family protein [Daldinia decipiens]KAI1655019.1 fumarylacetoacetate hydrolase family protein [Daldinia decipiens]
MSEPTFSNLIRFLDESSVELYGDVTNSSLDIIVGLVVPEGELMDYEGELCVSISKTGKNIPEEKALDYVLGVTAGNDLSSRKWQRPPYSGGQFTYAKSFDYFAPIGPTILHGSLIASNPPLKIKTIVNGEVRQNGSINEMLFNIEKIIAHASRGTTLR